MNSSFGRGFKTCFGRKNFSSFYKSNYNNKRILKFFQTNINSPFMKMQMANICFSSKALFLNNNQHSTVLGSKSLTGEAKNGVEIESFNNEEDKLGDGMTQNQGLILVKQGK